eukprot:gene10783-13204_t
MKFRSKTPKTRKAGHEPHGSSSRNQPNVRTKEYYDYYAKDDPYFDNADYGRSGSPIRGRDARDTRYEKERIDSSHGGRSDRGDYLTRDEYYGRDINSPRLGSRNSPRLTGKSSPNVYTGKERDYYTTSSRVDAYTPEQDRYVGRHNKVRGREYRNDYVQTQRGRRYEAPLLGPDGLPLNPASKADVPTNIMLKRHYNSVERLMETKIFRERADENTKKVVYDIKNILADLILMVEQRKLDQQFMNVFHDMKMFSGDISNDNELKTLLTDWKSTFVKLATGDKSQGLLSTLTKVLKDLKNSDSILRLFSEGAKFIQMIVLDRNNPNIEIQRELVFNEFFKAFKILAQNPAWQDFVLKSKSFGNEVHETRKYESKVAGSKFHAITSNKNFTSLNTNSRGLLQSFIRDKSVADVDKLFSYGNETLLEFKKNRAYDQFMMDFKSLTMEIMENPALVDDPATRKAIRDLYAKGEQLIIETRNNPSLQRFTNEASRIKDGIATDELNTRLYQHIVQFFHDLQGSQKSGVDLNVLRGLKMLTVPFLLEEFRTITIPPYKGMTPDRKYGYSIGNINLSAVELLPENIHIEFSHKTNADPYTLSIIDPDTTIWVELTAITARVEKIPWKFDKFTRPRISNEGLADVYLEGRGARVGVELRLLRHGNSRVTQVLDSYCTIHRLRINLNPRKKRWFYNLVLRLMNKRIKRLVEKAVAQQLAKMIAETDYKMVQRYHIAKTNNLRRKAKLHQKIVGIKSKLGNKTKRTRPVTTGTKQGSFWKTFFGPKKQHTTTTTTTTTTSLPVNTMAIPVTTTTTSVPVTTSSIPVTSTAPTTQYVLQPTGQQAQQTVVTQPYVTQVSSQSPFIKETTTTTTTTQPTFVKDTSMFKEPVKGSSTPEIAPTYVGPSSN